MFVIIAPIQIKEGHRGVFIEAAIDKWCPIRSNIFLGN